MASESRNTDFDCSVQALGVGLALFFVAPKAFAFGSFIL